MPYRYPQRFTSTSLTLLFHRLVALLLLIQRSDCLVSYVIGDSGPAREAAEAVLLDARATRRLQNWSLRPAEAVNRPHSLNPSSAYLPADPVALRVGLGYWNTLGRSYSAREYCHLRSSAGKLESMRSETRGRFNSFRSFPGIGSKCIRWDARSRRRKIRLIVISISITVVAISGTASSSTCNLEQKSLGFHDYKSLTSHPGTLPSEAMSPSSTQAPGASSSTKPSRPTSTRTLKACLTCRKRKVRCMPDEQTPNAPCAQCKQRKFECEYEDPNFSPLFRPMNPGPPGRGVPPSRSHASAVSGSQTATPYSPPVHAQVQRPPPGTADPRQLLYTATSQSPSRHPYTPQYGFGSESHARGAGDGLGAYFDPHFSSGGGPYPSAGFMNIPDQIHGQFEAQGHSGMWDTFNSVSEFDGYFQPPPGDASHRRY
ncbi:hypothetical protein C8F01DRAFT_446010 [Mycena amicta]|nr:hypothetical protein C8F01DRAFT_446010 [Mycena amicta]